MSERIVPVKHITIASDKKFSAVKSNLERQIPLINQEIFVLLAKGNLDQAQKIANGTKLFIFGVRDHGSILRSVSQQRNAIQYEIGNPLTALSMTRRKLSAALYAPLRVLLFESPNGGSVFEYDLPSSLFGQFHDEEIEKVGSELDSELRSAIEAALD